MHDDFVIETMSFLENMFCGVNIIKCRNTSIPLLIVIQTTQELPIELFMVFIVRVWTYYTVLNTRYISRCMKICYI